MQEQHPPGAPDLPHPAAESTGAPVAQSGPWSDELRESVRFESKLRQVTVRDDNGFQFEAKVLDESFGGLGLEVRDLAVHVGQQLEVTYNGVKMWATVQNLATRGASHVRLGLAWKAVGIATRARRACEPGLQEIAEDTTRRQLHRFLDMLPGGLYMMWNLFEHAKWLELDDAASRMAVSARRCGIHSVVQSVEQLRAAMRRGVRLGELRQKVDDLMELCLREADAVSTAHA